jgi:ABC-type amino acid transport substrate-binding protein/heat shock protein HslJ
VTRYALNRLLILAFVLLGLAACRQQAAVTPTLEPATPAATAAAPTPAPAADAWAAVQQRGRLIVGTSADYPPFAFYTDKFELDGFDVALARLLGERLGVEVEFSDMAFDGLGGALAVGQIDVAIAAISVTEGRRAVVDFSSVYHVSEDAALARVDTGIALRSPADLAPYRVGVQEGSVYQTWLQEAGVDAGVLSPENLLAYTETTAAVDDLIAGRVDVLIADRLPLEVVARDDAALAIVGRGLNEQQFAVALPIGSNLTARMNEALAALQAEGVLAELAEQYLSLEEAELAPLPTPQPAEAARSPLPVTGCLDAMTLVAHLNLDDADMTAPPPISPGAAFQKSWRVQNIGTCTWDSSYQLTPVGGNTPAARMGGRAVALPSAVAPGQTIDLTVDLVAPLAPGVYQGFWSMRAPTGLLFGERIWVGIDVAELPTPTPPPTGIPLPGVTFTVDRDSIRAGECVTFAWDVSGGGQVYFYAEGQPWQLNGVAANGARVECPNASTTYTLRINQADGTLDLRPIRIAVTPAPSAPFITFFTVTPSFQIAAGQCVEVRWQVEGEVGNVRVARGDTTLWDGAPLNGTSRDCPPVGEAVYTLDVSGPGGTAAGRQNVTVLPAQATAVPPIGSDQPVVNFFSATPGQIAPGQCVSVAWSVGGNVSRVQILRNGVVALDFALVSGSISDCLNTPGTYTYRVDAIAADGRVAFQQASVTVGAAQSSLGGGWRLVNLNGAAIIPGTEITAVFGDGGRLSGSSGCGAYSAAYQLNGSSLAVGSLSGSGQVCDQPAGIMQQEQLYQTVLAAASGYTLEGNQLTIRSARGQLTFERSG